jgi:predicted permease
MHALWADLRFALRLLRRTPAVSLIALATLAVGIGANTAIFTVVHSVVLAPLGFPAPERLVRLYTQFETLKLDRFSFSIPEYVDLARQARSFESIGAFGIGGAPVLGGQVPERVPAAYVTASMLPTLGVAPARGRFFLPEEEAPNAPRAVVIGHGLWQRAFGGSADILGRTIRVDSSWVRIVGVMPASFEFPTPEVQIWVPWGLQVEQTARASHNLSVVARLRAGVTLEQARAELTALEAGWKTQYKHALDGNHHRVFVASLKDELVAELKRPLWVLQGAVGFVLLIVCANLSSVLLARAEARVREVALRTALGASTGRLARQFMTESALLSLGGGALGLLLSGFCVDVMLALAPAGAPRLGEVRLSGPVLVFALGASILVTFLFGAAPLAHARLRDLRGALADGVRTTGGPARQRFRRTLVVVQVALAVVLVIGSVLMTRSFVHLSRVDLGFDPTHVLTFTIELPETDYPDADRVYGRWTAIEHRLAALPGAESATVLAGLPPIRLINANGFEIEGAPRPRDDSLPTVDFFQQLGDDYLGTLRVPLVEGRAFDERDREGAPPVVVVNQALARRFFPGQSPLGKRVRGGMDGPWRTIVGVVGDVKQQGVGAPVGTELYFPLRQPAFKGLPRVLNVALRTRGEPAALEPAVRRAIGELDGTLAIQGLRPMTAVIYQAVARPRFLTSLLDAFSLLALALAAIGIYGVMSYGVAQRRRELGIRMALGATRSGVRWLVLGQGLRLAAAGTALGLGLAVLVNGWLSPLLVDLLYRVDALDPLVFAQVGLIVLVVAASATYAPALRATRIDPMTTLRE